MGIDRDGECRPQLSGVPFRLRMQLQSIAALAGQRQTDQPAGVGHHEIDGRRRRMLRCKNDVSFILPVFIIDQDNHLAGFEIFQNFRYRAEWHSTILSPPPPIYSCPEITPVSRRLLMGHVRFSAFFIFALCLFATVAWAADFTGKVLDPDGKPVKHASVYLFDLSHVFEVPTTRRDAPTTQTDDAGVYRLASPDSKSAYLAATADGLGFGHNGTNTASSNRDIRLAHWTSVTLTFLAPDNTPAANVAVHVLSLFRPQSSTSGADAFFFPPPFRSFWSAKTDAHGQCTFAGLPQGEGLGVAVDDDRYIQPMRAVDLSNASKTQADPIQLSLGSSISGTVTDSATGKPVGGITVQAFSGPAQLGRALTAADGSYVINQLPAATYTLELVLNAQQQQSWTAKAIPGIVATPEKTQSGVDFSLIPGVILSGTVIAADDGKPLAGVPIGIFSPAHPRQGGRVQNVTTDSNGTFSARVPPGEQFVYIESSTPADGYSRPSPDNKTITIADGATGSVEFRLPRVLMSPIVGKVVDPDGNPVVGASVYVSSDMAPMFNRVPVATNADGVFQSLPMQRVGKIQIRAKFKNMGTPKPVLITRGATDIVIHLEKDALGSISGRVTDPQGNPLAGTEIVLITRTTRFSNGAAAGKTDAQGNFKIESVWPDPTYSVEAIRDGYGQNQTGQLHVQPGQDTHAQIS